MTKRANNSKPLSPGQVFGELTIVRQVDSVKTKSGKYTLSKYLVRCNCGKEYEVQRGNLITGNLKRCSDCYNAKRKMYGPSLRNDDLVNRKDCYRNYKRGAKDRDLIFGLSLDQFSNITSKNCYYCDSPPSNIFLLKHSRGHNKGLSRSGLPFIYNGIDRINSEEGYLIENCVPCCFICNRAKMNMPIDLFKGWIEKVYKNLYGEEHETLRS